VSKRVRPFLTLHDPATSRAFYKAGLWTEDTFYSLMAGHAVIPPESKGLQK